MPGPNGNFSGATVGQAFYTVGGDPNTGPTHAVWRYAETPCATATATPTPTPTATSVPPTPTATATGAPLWRLFVPGVFYNAALP
jgi:hypothetical protein